MASVASLNNAVQRTVCFKIKIGDNNMKALVYNGPRDVRVMNVPDAKIEQPTDVLVKITTTNICGSNLHMYEGRTDMEKGRIFGHENLGKVVAVSYTHLRAHETVLDLVCRLLLEKKNTKNKKQQPT